MLDNIAIELKNWDWKAQRVGNISISNLINNIESGFYRTKKVRMSIDIYDLRHDIFETKDLFDFILHYKLVENANLKYPVIVSNKGHIVDGRHRLVKAILKGKKYIDGIMIIEHINGLDD